MELEKAKTTLFTRTSPGVYFSTSKLRVTLPVSKESYIILRSEPIVNLRLLSSSATASGTGQSIGSAYSYAIESPSGDSSSSSGTELLKVDEHTGDLWVTSGIYELTNVTEFIVVARNATGQIPAARLSLTIEPQPVAEGALDSFCEHHPERACFWDTVQYRVAENGPRNWTIGTVGPAFYRRLCPQHQPAYELLRGEESNPAGGADRYLLVAPTDGTLRTRLSFDHDTHAPGPTLQAAVRCTLQQQGKVTGDGGSQSVDRTITVNVLDRNDNLPRLEAANGSVASGQEHHQQDLPSYDVYVDDPHVNQDDTVGHVRVVFTDDDSIPLNTRVHYKLHGDVLELFRPDCAMYENEHAGGLKQTVFGCKLVFARSGILRKSPYCVTLQAVDPTVELPKGAAKDEERRTSYANASICLSTNLNRIHEYDLPRPEALTSGGTSVVSPPGEGSGFRSGDGKVGGRRKSKKETVSPGKIAYPREAYVYDTSRRYARIAEPGSFRQLFQENRLDLNFRLTANPLDAFGITQNGGIIYLRNETVFRKQLESRHELTVAWKNYSVTILVKLRKNPDAVRCLSVAEERRITEEQHHGMELDFCAIHANATSCQSACGLGSLLGPCVYRPPSATSLPMWATAEYPTCSSGLSHCPDGICDPLEEMGHREQIHICPQDCVYRKDIVGLHHSDNAPRGIHTASGHCHCRSSGVCECTENVGIRPEDKRRKTTTSSSTSTTTTTTTITPSSESSDVEFVAGSKPQNGSLDGVKTGHRDRPEDSLPEAVRDGSYYEPGLIKGPHASIYLIAIVLIPMVVAVMIVLYCFSRKVTVKNKLLHGGTSSGPGGLNSIGMNLVSNDTEIFNVELPLASRMNEFNFKIDYDSKWEFPRANLILDATLGEGEFGKVLKGYATDLPDRPGITTVAVKMLKTGANSVELLALLSEYQLLQEVNHPNVIRLLGACTKGDSPLLIIEYCQYGSLKNYLRLSRKLEVMNADYENAVEPITVKDILSFAWQISKGMAYLTDIKLVHRDLAARNVLLAEGKVCKISDLGLTRDVYEDDAYLKKSKDRVPVKWMAPESLADHIYTSKSDVWAFGVLCWELITLGASPYPGIPPQNLYNLLKQGYRMECPKNCSEEIYGIVRSCWADDPKQRPSFKHLAGQFELLLGRSAKYIDMEQNSISNPVYCVNVDEVDCAKLAICKEEQDRLESLWTPPQYETVNDSSAAELTGRYQSPSSSERVVILPMTEDKRQLLLQSYDTPRPLIETATIEQKLRYENDVRLRPKKLGSSEEIDEVEGSIERLLQQKHHHHHYNTSNNSPPRGGRFEETSFITASASESSNGGGEYDSPSRQPKRVVSYLDMNRNCQNQLSANLEINHVVDKKQSKDIALRYSNVDNEQVHLVLVDPRTGETSALVDEDDRKLVMAPSTPPMVITAAVQREGEHHPKGVDGPTVQYTEVVKKHNIGKDPVGLTLTSTV
ncbi:uncharacterized protein LOC131293107 [Anopheles ziemanni]|uniref:uncharacterized protein LOC131264032 n=1 Tax=Anopheles coustani TaxID=139045 RepID=UPI00265933CF|nr:uncharacterized protein LOC131264032 [Anopheles coustani]XP_058177168.1 uncharacterized protein LOC131293107 [Anopheles ziemanni]